MNDSSRRIIELYERHAQAWDADRGRSLVEKRWLDRFARGVPPGGTLLDVGCGAGEPIARYLAQAGFATTGIDASPSLIAIARARFPAAEWMVADMRALALGRRFHGIIAWDSVFHLTMDEQRAMFTRFAAHALPGAPLLFTSGASEGEAIGAWRGEPLYHASLAPAEYERLLLSNGFTVQAHRADDPECGGHTVWLAMRRRRTDRPAARDDAPAIGAQARNAAPGAATVHAEAASRVESPPADASREEELMACCLAPSVSGEEDFTGPAGGEITLRLEADAGIGAAIVHIRYDTDPMDAEPPLQFTIRRGSKMLVVLVEASAPGAPLRLVEVCGGGREQVIDRFHFDPRNPARGYVITGA